MQSEIIAPRAGDAPLITLLTDFGSRDVYIGVVKGVLLSRCPGAGLVDLTHEVPAGDIEDAAYLLGTAWLYFPPGTVHLVVVDPGVGTQRAALAAEVAGHRFVAPDNGVLAAILDSHGGGHVVSIENQSLFLTPVSRTFHGRDIFAPAAAALAMGTPLSALGPPHTHWQQAPAAKLERDSRGNLLGQVIHIDRFGNLITNIPAAQARRGDLVVIGPHRIRIVTCYGDVPPGQVLALAGSTGRLEISINRGDAAQGLAASRGMAVHLMGEGAAET